VTVTAAATAKAVTVTAAAIAKVVTVTAEAIAKAAVTAKAMIEPCLSALVPVLNFER
jgi:hypothetical protein